MSKGMFRTVVVCSIAIFVITLAQPIFAQGLTWQVVGTKTDPDGNVTVTEQASNGLKRETWTSFHRGTSNKEIVKVTEINTDGSRIIKTRSWAANGTEKGFASEVQNSAGTVLSGERWFIDQSTGRRYLQKWDTARAWWVNAGNDDGPPTASSRRSVSIRYAPSRAADAQRAAQLLSQKGFVSSLVPIAEGSGQTYDRKLQYYRDADIDGANTISRTVNAIEVITPYYLGGDPGDEPADRHFELSLYAKKKPLVRIGYTQSRSNDAQNCEWVLEKLGFKVERQLAEESDVDNTVKNRLFYHRAGDKKVADSIPECLTNYDGEFTSTLRRISTGANPPDFQFVLTEKRVAASSKFIFSSDATQRTPNEDAEMNRRLKDVQEKWLPRLAPGQGVAHFIRRNAKDELDAGLSIDIRDAASGQIVKPAGGSWENHILPAGRYTATAIAREGWAYYGYSLPPAEFTVRAGAITQVHLGGHARLGRVIYDSKDSAAAPVSAYIFIRSKLKKDKYITATNGKGQIAVDLPPGTYYVDVNANKAMRISSEEFVVEAGKTTTIRPINRGRIAVTRENTLPGINAGVSTLSNELAGSLALGADDYVDVPAGEYNVANSRFSKRVVVSAGQTVVVKR